MSDLLSSFYTSTTGIDSGSTSTHPQISIVMSSEDDISVVDSPEDVDVQTNELSDHDRQLMSLATYLKSVPYECESVEEMQAKLEYIVGKIYISIESKNFLSHWDGMLQCWLLMRYPMPKPTRTKLVKLYYELCLLPGIDPRLMRVWTDIVAQLLANKPGQRRKLESADLQLPWRPLWRALQKELWPKKTIQEPLRNMVNMLLFLAEQCKRYYAASEIPEMLDAFMPLLTQDSILTMIPVMTSFLPPTHTHIYLPVFFKLWEAFNSSVIDERLLELCGDLAEEHVSGLAGDASEDGNAKWKDVGIWSKDQWTLLTGKALGAMNIPVGSTSGASSTAGQADESSDPTSLRIKKTINRYSTVAKLFVYSMSVDGPVRKDNSQDGFVAGSRALDSLDKLITSTESFFHPSNSGPWTIALTSFLQRITSDFVRRWKEEELPSCKTPVTHRLTPAIRREFVKILRTPALLAMFSKDPLSMGYAQGSLRTMAILQPSLIMPELLERAYGGLEVVNETHRTTAVLSMLSGVAYPLVTESIWLGGQKHVVPLLESCVPGIDLNDPIKTVCATMFIVATVQHIKIGDLSMSQSGVAFTDEPLEGGGQLDMEHDIERLPEGVESQAGFQVLSRSEERMLARESTAGFADWVTSLFRRVLALYENLPEEGGKNNKTGGKQEETVLRSIKNMLDTVCLHLSDPLFNLVLRLVYDYATTNAKSNAVKAFGQLIACLARVRPQETAEKFLPFCISQIKEELKHGASSIRTTSAGEAVPSDTTLHWNLVILRGCLGCDGAAPTLVKHKDEILGLLSLLVDKTKSERGYTLTGRLLTRILHVLTSVHVLNSRFMNSKEWNDPEFDRDHNLYWGHQYEAKEIDVEWHVPSKEEIEMALEILDAIHKPNLDRIEALVHSPGTWDNVSRNDFCRFTILCRAMWSGLATLIKEPTKDVANTFHYPETELEELLVTSLDVRAGFALTDKADPRYKRAVAHRQRFGEILHQAATALRSKSGGEDHIDAVMAVVKSIDVHLLEYGENRHGFETAQKGYATARDLNRIWPRQSKSSRYVYLQRAHVYHTGRLYMAALYRRRSALDDQLLGDLIEFSMSPYLRVRRYSQTVLHNAAGYYVRTTRFFLPILFDALAKGNDPDRMKGALYVLWNKGTATYALTDQELQLRYMTSLLECQHEEKPSIQKLVASLASDCVSHLSEESAHTYAFTHDAPGVRQALQDLEKEFSHRMVDRQLLKSSLEKSKLGAARREKRNAETIASILEIASRPQTHWRYVQIAIKFLNSLIRRDSPESPELAKFLGQHVISPQPGIRAYAQRSIVKMLSYIKIRSYAKSHEELWFDEWNNPLARRVNVTPELLRTLQFGQDSERNFFVDKITTGFLCWTPTIKSYSSPTAAPQWDASSQPALKALFSIMGSAEFWESLLQLWGQESSRSSRAAAELRHENFDLVKMLAKIFQHDILELLLTRTGPLLSDSDRFKQRAGAEVLAGLLRGSKHWAPAPSKALWSWTIPRLNTIFSQIKPDTLSIWESLFEYQLSDRDPRRFMPLMEWLMNLHLDFHGDSAFDTSKALIMSGLVPTTLGPRSNLLAGKFVGLLFENANTPYAEIRTHIAQHLHIVSRNLWQPSYPSAQKFVRACAESSDPLHIRSLPFMDMIRGIQQRMTQWKNERLPPPRVSQSEYDKVGLTLLQYLWIQGHNAQACLMFPYAMTLMPDIMQMAELQDSSDLQSYSTAVLYLLSAVNLPQEYVKVILDNFTQAIKSAASWRVRLHAFPALMVFFYRNLMAMTEGDVEKVMDVLLDCLADDNVEVREVASKALSGLVRCSQRQSIIPLKNRFVGLARKTALPKRSDPKYASSLKSLHSAILGLCALIESFPYSVEPWMPGLTEVLAPHATDPPPISTTIRKCASEFKKTHQDTWHKDQLAFNEDQIQSLSTMLVGTSYYA